jgi:hypothetical protein
VAQVVQHLPNKHEGLSSNSRTAKKKKREKRKEFKHFYTKDSNARNER